MIKFTSLYISSGKLLSDTIVVVLNNSILSVCTLFQLLAAIKIIKINAINNISGLIGVSSN